MSRSAIASTRSVLAGEAPVHRRLVGAERCPVLSVPSGRSRDGVPTGLSIVGKTYDDVTAFRVAAAHEARFPWLDQPSRRPAL
jgi:Asp-tRNA(Asn)/Glu-tRNA(Gln) amidotransferase A subunit family amidase